jgi:hypothetical protein
MAKRGYKLRILSFLSWFLRLICNVHVFKLWIIFNFSFKRVF